MAESNVAASFAAPGRRDDGGDEEPHVQQLAVVSNVPSQPFETEPDLERLARCIRVATRLEVRAWSLDGSNVQFARNHRGTVKVLLGGTPRELQRVVEHPHLLVRDEAGTYIGASVEVPPPFGATAMIELGRFGLVPRALVTSGPLSIRGVDFHVVNLYGNHVPRVNVPRDGAAYVVRAELLFGHLTFEQEHCGCEGVNRTIEVLSQGDVFIEQWDCLGARTHVKDKGFNRAIVRARSDAAIHRLFDVVHDRVFFVAWNSIVLSHCDTGLHGTENRIAPGGRTWPDWYATELRTRMMGSPSTRGDTFYSQGVRMAVERPRPRPR